MYVCICIGCGVMYLAQLTGQSIHVAMEDITNSKAENFTKSITNLKTVIEDTT